MSDSQDVSGKRCVVVFTCRGRGRLLREGGSQAWRMDASRASKCEYVICVQNRNETWGEPTAPHKEAFLIARVQGIVPAEQSPDRQMILFNSAAEISIPDKWDGNRNPVAYMTLGDFGINTQQDLDGLKFFRYMKNALERAPEATIVGDEYLAALIDDGESKELSCSVDELTVDQAKAGLAKRFGVKLEQIKIVIEV